MTFTLIIILCYTQADCKQLRHENQALLDENRSLKDKLGNHSQQCRTTMMNTVLKSDESVRHYTGLPTLAFLYALLQVLTPFCSVMNYWKGPPSAGNKNWQDKGQKRPGTTRKLSLLQEFVLTLMRLRLGIDTVTLSHWFGISKSQVSKIFATWINFLNQVLGVLIKWPSREKVQKHMPLAFKLKYPKTRVIIDCTEMYVQRPKNPTAQSKTWSNYKSHNTYKALVGITPNGSFSFVSDFWSGNTSDRKITEASGLINKLEKGDHVMADRGFQIQDLVLKKRAYLNMPPFTRKCLKGKGKMLTKGDIRETKKIAALRIHVERAIRRLKLFKLLGNTLPLNMKPLANQMLTVSAVLCNFYPPLVKKYKK
jgi:hypothetical protein